MNQGASAAGVATLAGDRVLDVYYPQPRLGAEGEPGTRTTGQARLRRDPRRAHRAGPHVDRVARRPARRRLRRLPAPAPALAPADPAARGEPRRRVRSAQQRRVDEPRPGRPGRRPRGPAPPARRRRAVPGLLGRQVPAHDRLRRPVRRADRGRRPRPPRRPPRERHHGHARGVRELQRRHARALDGRGPHQRRAWWSATGPTSAAAPRSWARCRAAAPRSSRSGSDACWAPTPASGSRSATTAWSRPAST